VTAVPLLPAAPAQQTRDAMTAAAQRVVASVETVVHGRAKAVELVACALLAGGHALIEDVPGSGKTTLARAFARSVGGSFNRIQATADLLPSDITGSGVWDPDDHSFRFVPGPLFAQLVLIDELNRASPRTQSALLEAMDEGAVTIDGTRHQLPDPFFVVATQNPLEQHGTYPLPEGQLDRFAVCLRLGDLSLDAERLVIREQLVRPTVDDLTPVVAAEQLRAVRDGVRSTYVADPVLEHALALVRATRGDQRLRLGASSRAAITLVRCAQARALLQGREYVVPDDTKALAPSVLGHRLVLSDGSTGSARGEEVVADLLTRLPVPLQR
jgi:MoxR-like ATPase